MLTSRVVAAGIALACAAVAPATPANADAATVGWTQLHPVMSPEGARSAYDSATGQLVMLPDFVPGNPPTWTWDGDSWTPHITPSSPRVDTQYGEAIGYDNATRQLVVFGGGSGDGSSLQSYNDTWTWNGSIWAKLHPAASPPARRGAELAYDPVGGRLILHGGASGYPPLYGQVFADTWAWDGSTWTELHPAHVPATGGFLVSDSALGRLVLISSPSADVVDLWIWDGSDWSSVGSTTGPPSSASFTFDADTGQVLAFGGVMSANGAAAFSNDLWAWEGSTWRKLSASLAPSARLGGIFVFDQSTHQGVLFGGDTCGQCAGTDTWVYAGKPSGRPVTPTRLGGSGREQTAVVVSQAQFAAAGSASAVVVARGDAYPDALAGGPLAASKHAPLLLTSPNVLDAVTADEIVRVLPRGGTVYLLGGTAALSPAVAAAVTALGAVVVRLGGSTRAATAVVIAAELGNPSTVFEASGANFPDALSAVAATVKVHAAIMLTDGTTQDPATAAYLTAHAGVRYAVGGPAAWADPSAIALEGADRYATSQAVALAFFPTVDGISLASGVGFPDALAAGPYAGALGQPVLLVPPDGALPEPAAAYAQTHGNGLAGINIFGGNSALSDSVAVAVSRAAAGT